MKYIMFQNPGVAPSECFTLLGVSTTRNSNVSGTIGTFGSGSKYSVSLLLRLYCVGPTIFCGNLKLEFFTKEVPIDDGIDKNWFKQVCVKYAGKDENNKTNNRTENLGWVIEHGNRDWNDASMAFREFTSNAIDRSLREGKDGEVKIEIVEENQVRAKSGYTRVFFPAVPDAIEFYNSLHKRFLFFTGKEKVYGTLTKKDRNLPDASSKQIGNGAVIFKQGVRIREIGNNSLFDYNFEGDELQLDESRNAYSSNVRRVVLDKILRGKDAVIEKVITALIKEEKVFETEELVGLDFWYSQQNGFNSQHTKAWQKIWDKLTNGVGCLSSNSDALNIILSDKGYLPIKCPPGWMDILNKIGIRTPAQVLSKDDQEGFKFYTPRPIIITIAKEVAGFFTELLGRTIKVPNIKEFTKPPVNGVVTYGQWRLSENLILINKELCDMLFEPDSKLYEVSVGRIYETMIEEYVHYISEAGDFCRELQGCYNKLIRLALFKDKKAKSQVVDRVLNLITT